MISHIFCRRPKTYGTPCILRATSSIFMKLMRFLLGGHGSSSEGATPSYIPDFRSPTLGLSNEAQMIFNSTGKVAKKSLIV